jgi:hypothetical protein
MFALAIVPVLEPATDIAKLSKAAALLSEEEAVFEGSIEPLKDAHTTLLVDLAPHPLTRAEMNWQLRSCMLSVGQEQGRSIPQAPLRQGHQERRKEDQARPGKAKHAKVLTKQHGSQWAQKSIPSRAARQNEISRGLMPAAKIP